MKEADTQFLFGLSSSEAQARLAIEGPNEIDSGKSSPFLSLILEVLLEPMILLLLGASTLYFILGDLSEAFLLLFSVLLITLITFFQEYKTSKALKTLRELSSPRALVIRDGINQRIAGREVVREDLVILKEGDRIPADAYLIDCLNLHVDESLLTGESVPVRKALGKITPPHIRPGGDDSPYVYSGSLVTQGQGIAKVIAIGRQTELGKIGKTLTHIESQKSLLQIQTQKLTKFMAIFGLGFCILTALFYSLIHHNWIQGSLVGITMAMSMIPEEIPIILTAFLALGAWRLSKQKVLTRKSNAIETLGATTVLCVDKTGTLTQNKMEIHILYTQKQTLEISQSLQEIPETFHELSEYSILASQKDPFDPMEKSLKQLGENYLKDTAHLHKNWKLLREYPLSKDLLALSHVWQSPEGSEYMIAAKGAPEAIMDLCHLNASEQEHLLRKVHKIASKGLRVLGVAKAVFKTAELPNIQHDFDFKWLGLIGFADPIRPQVSQAMRECISAGIRVVMITGDYAETARSVASQIGLHSDSVMTGAEIKNIPDTDLKEKIKSINIFARMMPEQKLKLVKALQANGEVVAMTGDGVNDAPALKAAHIGIAMGERGSDVARESASLVLVDDDFSSIVHAIRMGRRIYDNIQKALFYILAVKIPIAGLSLLPVLLQWPLILMPIHIVFLEFIIDPSSSIVFENQKEEDNIMQRPPRNKNAKFLNTTNIFNSCLQGLGILSISLAILFLSQKMKFSADSTRALGFITLTASNIALTINNLSKKPFWKGNNFYLNKSFWWVCVGTTGSLYLIFQIPFLLKLFRFQTPSGNWFVISILLVLIFFIWNELSKIIFSSNK